MPVKTCCRKFGQWLGTFTITNFLSLFFFSRYTLPDTLLKSLSQKSPDLAFHAVPACVQECDLVPQAECGLVVV